MTDVTLVDFLLARIAEDEAVARAASPAMWLPEDKGITFDWRFEDLADPDGRARLEASTWANVDHISRWSPHQVLAECEAKRRIIAAHAVPVEDQHDDGAPDCPDCLQRWPCTTLRLLTLPYADHPDYRQEWAP